MVQILVNRTIVAVATEGELFNFLEMNRSKLAGTSNCVTLQLWDYTLYYSYEATTAKKRGLCTRFFRRVEEMIDRPNSADCKKVDFYVNGIPLKVSCVEDLWAFVSDNFAYIAKGAGFKRHVYIVPDRRENLICKIDIKNLSLAAFKSHFNSFFSKSISSEDIPREFNAEYLLDPTNQKEVKMNIVSRTQLPREFNCYGDRFMRVDPVHSLQVSSLITNVLSRPCDVFAVNLSTGELTVLTRARLVEAGVIVDPVPVYVMEMICPDGTRIMKAVRTTKECIDILDSVQQLHSKSGEVVRGCMKRDNSIQRRFVVKYGDKGAHYETIFGSVIRG